ncbi:MAG: class I SAM-dependent methyltransferase [Candidatus Micrarchaeia archaeon]
MGKRIKLHSFESFGNIAILKLKKEERKKAKEIAKEIMKVNKNIESVFEKLKVKGRYRKRNFRFIAGKRKYIANYKENSCVFVFDIRKVYFSSRLSYERKRISEGVKEGENVLVLFAGVGPYAIEIAKKGKAKRVVAIELNKWACYYMRKNILLNRVNVEVVQGDVKKKIFSFKDFADRIVAPLPKSSYRFLKEIFFAAKNNCIVHYYSFCRKNRIEDVKKVIEEEAKKEKVKVNFIFERVVKGYSPKEDIVVVDFIVKKL